MKNIKKGDIVVRKSYNKDIVFSVKNIINIKKGKIAILRGLIERVEADSDINDLEILTKQQIRTKLKELDNRLNIRIKTDKEKIGDNNYKIGVLINNKRAKEKIILGKILHLDGDRKYSEKSYRYYKKLGLNAIVKHIPEYRQPHLVYNLLAMYDPDILVITRT